VVGSELYGVVQPTTSAQRSYLQGKGPSRLHREAVLSRFGLKEIVRPLQFEDIVRVVSRHRGENWEKYASRRGDWRRDMMLLLARKNTMMTKTELAARAGGIDDSAVAHAVRRLTTRIQESARLALALKILQKEIAQMS
jgi:chromosomal replication initiation ATPase DnaA